MKIIACGFATIVLAALTSGCGFSEHTYAVQAEPTPVAVPGTAYYYSNGYYYYPSTGTYVRAY